MLGQVSQSDDRHTDERLADVADLVLAVARVITTDTHLDPDIVDLTATEISVMRFIDRHHGTSPTAVAAATGLQRSNLSRALRELEAKGMVTRSADEADGRQSRLIPTARAAANLRRLRANWSRLLGSVDIDRRHLDAALTVLAELDAGLGAAAQSAVARDQTSSTSRSRP
jgi:DNA-binding MarR family transcriptional regulator